MRREGQRHVGQMAEYKLKVEKHPFSFINRPRYSLERSRCTEHRLLPTPPEHHTWSISPVSHHET